MRPPLRGDQSDVLGGQGSYKERLDRLADNSLVNGKGKHRTGVVHYKRYAASRGWKGNQAWGEGWSEEKLADALAGFGLYLTDKKTVSYESMTTYMGEARRWLEIKGRINRFEFQARHQAVLRKMKEARHRRPQRKRALTGRMLRRWRVKLDKAGTKAKTADWSAWMVMSLAFYGLLRGSEVIGRRGKRECLTWANVKFYHDHRGVLQYMKLHIERSKTDVYAFGADVIIHADSLELSNPVNLLYQWSRARGGKTEHPVCPGARPEKAISYYLVNKAVKSLAEDLGLDTTEWGTHSGRAGGATAMWLSGATGDQVRAAGRWASDTYLIYLRVDQAIKIKWMRAMANTKKAVEWAQPMAAMAA